MQQLPRHYSPAVAVADAVAVVVVDFTVAVIAAAVIFMVVVVTVAFMAIRMAADTVALEDIPEATELFVAIDPDVIFQKVALNTKLAK